VDETPGPHLSHAVGPNRLPQLTPLEQAHRSRFLRFFASTDRKAQLRLCKRYRLLSARGKHVNQVVVAIAREMAAFAWAIANAQAVPA